MFINMNISTEGIIAKVIYKVSPYTLGVYLLHEQIDMRYLWPQWLGASAEGNVFLLLIRCLLAVIIVFVIGIVVDIIRSKVFKGVAGVVRKLVQKA